MKSKFFYFLTLARNLKFLSEPTFLLASRVPPPQLWSWSSPSLSLSFLICKMGRMTTQPPLPPPHTGIGRIQWTKAWEGSSTIAGSQETGKNYLVKEWVLTSVINNFYYYDNYSESVFQKGLHLKVAFSAVIHKRQCELCRISRRWRERGRAGRVSSALEVNGWGGHLIALFKKPSLLKFNWYTMNCTYLVCTIWWVWTQVNTHDTIATGKGIWATLKASLCPLGFMFCFVLFSRKNT